MKFKNLLSLKSFIVLGFVIAVIPLFLAVMYAAFGMRETSALGRTVNSQVFEQTKTIRQVLQKTADIERKARLFVLLSDPALRQPYERQSYESARASFKQALNELLKLQLDNKIALLINELSEKENLIYEQIISTEKETILELPIDEAFQRLRESSYTLSREFENHVDYEFNELREMSESLEQGLLIRGAILLAISFTVIAALLIVLSRSMRQLDAAIRRLESGDLDETISVTGPSDISHLGQRLEWLRTRLKDLEVAKQQFVQNVVREIEHPLQDIRETAQLLASETHTDTKLGLQNIAGKLSVNIEKLKTLSNELVRYSQIDSTLEIKSKQAVDMKGLLESVIEDFHSEFVAKSITLRMLVEPVEILGIQEQLRRVIEQLFANAVKYSPIEGEIRIMLRNTGMEMELEVEDEGSGICAEERLHVFEPFYHGAPTLTEDHAEGSNLELAVVKEYVVNHQGSIELIDSRPDQHGTHIRVKIPLIKEN